MMMLHMVRELIQQIQNYFEHTNFNNGRELISLKKFC